MFDNLGSKIKLVAKVICYIGIIASVIGAFILFGNAAEYRWMEHLWYYGFAVLILGSIISWVTSLFLYGFGELIENTAQIAYNTNKNK